MLFLLFTLGADRYALDAAQIVEVLPLAHLKEVPAAPPWVAGLLHHQNQSIPVIDLCSLVSGRPARQLMSTRLVLVHYPAPGPHARPLGMLVEQATATLRAAPGEFTDPGLASPEATWLGPVRRDARGLVQWVQVAALLPAAVRERLYPDLAA